MFRIHLQYEDTDTRWRSASFHQHYTVNAYSCIFGSLSENNSSKVLCYCSINANFKKIINYVIDIFSVFIYQVACFHSFVVGFSRNVSAESECLLRVVLSNYSQVME